MALFNEKLIANKDLVTTRGADVSTSGTIADLANAGFSFVRLTAATQLTSVVADTDGKELTIVNANTVPILVKNESGTAANRILTGTAADASLEAGASMTLIYDGGASRWRIKSALAHEGGRIVLIGSISGATSCTYTATNANLNGFSTNASCNNASYSYNPISIGATTTSKTPAFNVQNVPIGVYEVSFTFCCQMNTSDDAFFCIFDGNTQAPGTSPSIITSTLTQLTTVTGVFVYTSPVTSGGFTVYAAASSGRTITLFNDNSKRPVTFQVTRYPL